MTVFYEEKEGVKVNAEEREREYFFGVNAEDRIRERLMDIFAKFRKPYQKQKRQYFHSNDVFKEIGEQSEDEDSEEERTNLEKELERLRINDFSDVNEGDKAFMIRWDEIVHNYKSKNGVLGNNETMEMLCEFAVVGKREGMKRINMTMHGWTMWSSGKISRDDVLVFLKCFDAASDK